MIKISFSRLWDETHANLGILYECVKFTNPQSTSMIDYGQIPIILRVLICIAVEKRLA